MDVPSDVADVCTVCTGSTGGPVLTGCAPYRLVVETLGLGTTEVVSVVWSGQPADAQDELDLVDVYDPELDLLDDIDEWED